MNPILENRVELVEVVRAHYHATVPDEITPEDILDPCYFSNAVAKLKVGTRVELMSETKKLWGEVVVTRIDAERRLIWVAFIIPLTSIVPQKIDMAKDVTFELDAKGAYRVVRGKKVLKSGFPDKLTAEIWAAGGVD